jgi:uncharacterized protein YigE (DUF2233 family)
MKGTTMMICLFAVATQAQTKWKYLQNGLEISEYKVSQKSIYDNSTITILKIDPEKYSFLLFNEQMKTVEQTAKENNLVATINAGMFQRNYKNMGYMKNYENYNNPMRNKDKAILAFNRKDDSVPRVQIIDTEHQDWNELKTKYHSYAQSIRMIDLKQKNVWSLQDKMWSVACIAMDRKGNVLLIHCRSPYKMHDFINIMLQSPYNIRNMMYLEGGPEASLYIETDIAIQRRVGSYETSFREDNANNSYWYIPNTIGIRKR